MENLYFNNRQKQKSEAFMVVSLGIKARLDAGETAKVLGFSTNDIPVLITEKMLKPLGKPVPNSTKYFSAYVIAGLADNPEWLNEATQIIYDHWKGRNARKSINLPRTQTAFSEVAIAA
jgi:hypothetical protein